MMYLWKKMLVRISLAKTWAKCERDRPFTQLHTITKENQTMEDNNVKSTEIQEEVLTEEQSNTEVSENEPAGIVDEIKHKALSFQAMEATHSYQHPKNLNAILCDGVQLGEIGIVHPAASKQIDKKAAIVYAELDVVALSEISDAGIHYEEASKYPSMEVDLTFLSEAYAPIQDAIVAANSPLIKKVKVIDIYSGEEGDSITVRLTFTCMDRTLTREEVQTVTDGIVAALADKNIRMKLA